MSRSEIALVARAVRSRWNIPQAARDEIVAEMRRIVKRDAGEGDVVGTRDVVAAAKVLVACEGQNQRDDIAAEPQQVSVTGTLKLVPAESLSDDELAAIIAGGRRRAGPPA